VKRFAALALAALASLAAPSSRAEPQPGPKPSAEPEELRVVIARRARELTGTPVRIAELRYELIGSRFVGAGIEAGPVGNPYVKLPNLVVELALLAGGGRTIASVEASGPRVSIPGEWLGRALRKGRAHGALTVRSVKLRGGRITIRLGGGRAPVVLDGVDLSLNDLVIPAGAAGDPFRASGSVKLVVKRATLGELALHRLVAQGKLSGDTLALELQLAGLGGNVRLAGKLALGAELGPLELKGSTELRPAGAAGPRVWGPLTLKGKTLEAILLEGKLRSERELEPRRGKAELPPLLRMRVKVGKRELRGTLTDWQLR
jgi:hypothetical protein